MEIRLYATLRPIVGGRTVEVPNRCATIGDVLATLSDDYPDLAPHLLDDDGAMRPYVAVMVNGRDIRHLDGLQTAIGTDSGIDIFPPVAGGAG
ncbi:MAG TPA: ubiquitin-like small modifier protein 1 [Dehalococcoidia bacterium]|nr:ubiquitin-like small modifier protein 1 [Dehalococcoidia bacterium]